MTKRWQSFILAVAALWCDQVSAQPPDPRFRPRYSFASVRLHRTDLTEFSELSPKEELLNRWQMALTEFREVAGMVARQTFTAAGARLNILAQELPAPYNEYARAIRQERLENLIQSEQRGFKQLEGYRLYLKLGQTCADLGHRELAVNLLHLGLAVGPFEEREAHTLADDLRPFALTELELTAFARKSPHPAALAYFRLSLAALRDAKGGSPVQDANTRRPSLGMVLSSLAARHRALTADSPDEERLAVYEATIAALNASAQRAERDAWQTRLLIEFRHAHDACAPVYFERGVRAHWAGQREAALVSFQKLCRHHASSAHYGRALYHVGQILQERGQISEAIDAYQRVFATRDEDVLPGNSLMSMVSELRHETALRLAECFAERNDPARALAWIETMKARYPVRDLTSACDELVRAHENVFEAQVLAQLGRKEASLQLLEGLVSSEPNEALDVAKRLVTLYHEAGQLKDLETRLRAAHHARAALWVQTAEAAIAQLRQEQKREFEPHIWEIN